MQIRPSTQTPKHKQTFTSSIYTAHQTPEHSKTRKAKVKKQKCIDFEGSQRLKEGLKVTFFLLPSQKQCILPNAASLANMFFAEIRLSGLSEAPTLAIFRPTVPASPCYIEIIFILQVGWRRKWNFAPQLKQDRSCSRG